METSFLVDKRELRALEAFIGRDPTRNSLSCLHFFDDGRLGATDGHALLLRDPKRGVQKNRNLVFSIDRRMVSMLVRAMEAKGCARIGPLVDKNHAEFAIGRRSSVWGDDFAADLKGQMLVALGDVTPPDFDKVIPKLGKERSAPRVGLAVRLLKRLDFVRLAANTTHRGLEMYPPLNETDAVMFKTGSIGTAHDVTWTVLLMPMRI
jgi:hypothetical protein